MNLKRTKKGFTIVELVIVVGVIGILSAILIPTFVNLTENARKSALQLNLRNAYSLVAEDLVDGYVGDEKTGAALATDADYSQGVVRFKDSNNNVYKWDATNTKYTSEGASVEGWVAIRSEAYNGFVAYTAESILAA